MQALEKVLGIVEVKFKNKKHLPSRGPNLMGKWKTKWMMLVHGIKVCVGHESTGGDHVTQGGSRFS